MFFKEETEKEKQTRLTSSYNVLIIQTFLTICIILFCGVMGYNIEIIISLIGLVLIELILYFIFYKIGIKK